MSKKTNWISIVWDILKFILTFGISHLGKRRERLADTFTQEQLERSKRLQNVLDTVVDVGDSFSDKLDDIYNDNNKVNV